ncbi:MAG TPA: dipicolinate synthase subunit DpsA [Bacillota bacterium]|nr:dipicolinate synthase subunit DpsA [Bacillota bacterium]HPT87950.1 dipicolinate synthase subunit DpsA [Bacillota bacterium]
MKHIQNTEIAVIGGDSRQIAVAAALAGFGAKVRIFGHPSQAGEGMTFCENLEQAIAGVQVIILPISGMNDQGKVRGRTVDQLLDVGSCSSIWSPGMIVLSGSLTEKWRRIAAESGVIVKEYGENDEIAILNSIPTAEGTIQLAMENLPITIHGSRVLVIGFGRVGVTVARMFQALGATVTVAARRRDLLARAWEMGCRTVLHDQLSTAVSAVDLIINTVPVMVLDDRILSLVSRDTVIIDLASPPGGTDFIAAETLGVKAILAPGLPGKVAPKTAGAILAKAIPEILEQLLTEGGGR